MKKSFVLGSLIICLLLISASCSNPGEKAIKQAEKEIKIEESDFLGKYQSLCEQREKAFENLELIYDEKKAKIEDANFSLNQDNLSEKDETKIIKALKKVALLKVEEEEYEKELELYYTEKIKDELKELNGKEIPIKADSKYFSDASAKLYCDVEREKIYFHITVSIAPENKMNWTSYRYNGNRLGYFFTDANGNAININDLSINLVDRNQKFKKTDVKREFYMPLSKNNIADLKYGILVTSVCQ